MKNLKVILNSLKDAPSRIASGTSGFSNASKNSTNSANSSTSVNSENSVNSATSEILGNFEEDSQIVDFLLSPLKRVQNMTSELFQNSGGLKQLKNLKVKEKTHRVR